MTPSQNVYAMRGPPHALGSQGVEDSEGVVVFWALVVVPERRVRRSMAEQKMAAAAAGT